MSDSNSRYATFFSQYDRCTGADITCVASANPTHCCFDVMIRYIGVLSDIDGINTDSSLYPNLNSNVVLEVVP